MFFPVGVLSVRERAEFVGPWKHLDGGTIALEAAGEVRYAAHRAIGA